MNRLQIPGAPAELQARIDAHRARFEGLFMSLDGGDGQAAPGGQPAEQQPQQPQGGQPQQPQQGDESADELDRLRAEVQSLRAENADKRVRARDAEQAANTKLLAGLQALQEAGILPEGVKLDNTTDPLKVAEAAAEEARVSASASRAQAVQSQAEVAVWRNSSTLGLNAAAITDSKAFGEAIKDLDPTDAEFDKKVLAAAQEAAAKNPVLKATAQAGRGGSTFNGGTGERLKVNEFDSLAGAIGADLSK